MATVIFVLVVIALAHVLSFLFSFSQRRQFRNAPETVKVIHSPRANLASFLMWSGWVFAVLAGFQGRVVVCVLLAILSPVALVRVLWRAAGKDVENNRRL